jgi:hypothetical protein
MPDVIQVLFVDLGYTVYQFIPNQPEGAATAIDVTAEPTEPTAQRFARRLVLPQAPAAARPLSLEAAAETCMRRVLEVVVHDGLRVKVASNRNCLRRFLHGQNARGRLTAIRPE